MVSVDLAGFVMKLFLSGYWSPQRAREKQGHKHKVQRQRPAAHSVGQGREEKPRGEKAKRANAE